MQDQQAFQALWAAKIYILVGAAIGLFLSISLLLVLTPQYRGEMIVAPTNKVEGKDYSALLPDADLPALQYFVQRISGNGSTDFTSFETLMRTSKVAEEIFKNKIILSKLLPTEKQTVNHLRDFLQKEVSVVPVGATVMRKISFDHPNADFAKVFLQILYDKTEAVLKQDVYNRAETLITHLEQALVKTRNPDHKQALVTLLKEQEHLKLLSSIDVPYAAQLIEPPVVGARPISPNGWLLVPVLLLFGAVAGYVGYVIRTVLDD